MDVKARRGHFHGHSGATTLGEWLRSRRSALTEEDLIAALDGMTRETSAVELSEHDRQFWAAHSGITATEADVVEASTANMAARMLMDSTALTASEVAERLKLSPSTIRHYKADKRLFSYTVNGRLVFPEWQFTHSGTRALPHLEAVLRALPDDLHPQSVAGFFLTPQEDLRTEDRPVSVKEWLEAGGKAGPVTELAGALSAGY